LISLSISVAFVFSTFLMPAWAAPLDSATDFATLAARAAAETEGVNAFPGSVLAAPTCSASVSGYQLCIGQAPPSLAQPATPPLTSSSSDSVLPLPSWCTQAPVGTRLSSRVQSCEIDAVYVSKIQYDSNGNAQEVGRAYLNYYNWQYTAFDIPAVAHQFGFSVYQIQGDVSGMTLSGTGACSGSCVTQTPASIADGPIVLGQWQEASGGYGPTDTTTGSVYYLSTNSTLSATLNGVTSSTSGLDFSVRCDNASGGSSPKPGCAIWFVPGVVQYSRTKLPTFTTHVSQALTSGLHGGNIYDPVHRTTDATRIAANRSAACGNPPSVPSFSCDEYPFASTYEGAASGGTARSFPNCLFLDPPATGSSGYSRCMISATENLSAGGTLVNVYTGQRILDGDPLFVSITN